MKKAVTFADVAQSFFEFSDLPLASLHENLCIGVANPAFLRHFGGTSEQRVGQNFIDLLHPAAKDMLDRRFEKLRSGRYRHFTERMVALGPGECVFSGMLTSVAASDDDGRVIAIAVHVEPDGILSDASPSSPNRALSSLDARIMEGVAAGASTVQLSERLYLSRQGVDYRIAAMLRRHQAPNRTALVARAYAKGLLGIGSWPPRVLPEVTR